MAKHKHLTLDERYKIQNMLDARESFSSIAKLLGRDRSTISKEIRKHISFKQSGCLGRPFNDCTHRTVCERLDCPQKCPVCRNGFCSACIRYCLRYKKEICQRHTSKPYVCNGCSKRPRCSLEKRIYSASAANKEYRITLSETRQGVTITEKEALALDRYISPLILNGQSIHHIVKTNPSDVMFSEKTIYNYMDLGLFTAKNIDLPRKVKFRPRKSKHDSIKIDKRCRIGRTYDDFKAYMKDHPDTPIVELDTVIGTVGGKCLLTIHFVGSSFMLAFLRERNTASSVSDIFNSLYKKLEYGRFTKLFPVILTDNGSEFSDPLSLEIDDDGVIRTKVFYCNPSSPYQKGSAENNHEFIRRVLPKGASFDTLTQEDIDLMMNHINSYKRENLAWHSPYEIFELFYGRNILDTLGAKRIPTKDIILTPKLLK